MYPEVLSFVFLALIITKTSCNRPSMEKERMRDPDHYGWERIRIPRKRTFSEMIE